MYVPELGMVALTQWLVLSKIVAIVHEVEVGHRILVTGLAS
jgi:hypothetical protein